MLQGRVAAPGLKPNGDGGEDGLSKAMSATAGYRVDCGSARWEWASKTVRQELRVVLKPFTWEKTGEEDV